MDNKVILFPVSMDDLLSSIQAMLSAELQKQKEFEYNEKLLAPKEACKLFEPKISIVTLAKWTKDGLIPFHRIGGRVYYKTSEVLNSVKSTTKYKRKTEL